MFLGVLTVAAVQGQLKIRTRRLLADQELVVFDVYVYGDDGQGSAVGRRLWEVRKIQKMYALAIEAGPGGCTRQRPELRWWHKAVEAAKYFFTPHYPPLPLSQYPRQHNILHKLLCQTFSQKLPRGCAQTPYPGGRRHQAGSSPQTDAGEQELDAETGEGDQVEQQDCDNHNSSVQDGEVHKRGETLLAHVWNLPAAERIVVKCNRFGQPIGKEGGLLGQFLGTVARNGGYCPLNIKDWRLVKQNGGDETITDLVKAKFLYPQSYEKWVLKSVGRDWRQYKAALKKSLFNVKKKDWVGQALEIKERQGRK